MAKTLAAFLAAASRPARPQANRRDEGGDEEGENSKPGGAIEMHHAQISACLPGDWTVLRNYYDCTSCSSRPCVRSSLVTGLLQSDGYTGAQSQRAEPQSASVHRLRHRKDRLQRLYVIFRMMQPSVR